MEQDEDPYFAAYIDACMHCGAERDESMSPEEAAKCLLCDRYFKKQKLFLNNVG